MTNTSAGNQARKPRTIATKILASLLFGLLCAAACAAFLLYSLGGLPSKKTAAPTPQLQIGLSLYSANCAICHEQNQLHLNPQPPNLHGLFSRPNLPSGASANDAEVTRVILHGRNTMPAFAPRLTASEVAAIVAYLRTGTRYSGPPIGLEGAPEINAIFSQEKWHSQTVPTPQP
jgi:mono/diheme cytochrome c family protein